MAQDAELKLRVSLDLGFFRQQLAGLGQVAAGYSMPINVKFDRSVITKELRNLERALGKKKINIELNLLGGLTKDQLERIQGRLEALSKTKKVEIPVSIKNGATGKDADKVVASIKERLAQNQQIKQGGGKLRIETSVKPSITNEDIAVFKKAVKNKLSKIGALEIPTKLDVPKAEDLLKALQKNINRQKPLLAKTSIKPSILSADVKAFKKAVESKLSGITVKINAELETIGGGKTKAQIEKEVLAGLERIQQMGAERMGGGVTEPARRESLRQSLQGRDIGELKDIGKQLGVAGVGKFRNTQNLIERIVTEASIEMITKYLDPQAVMRNPDRSGLNKVLDTFARAFFRSFMSEEQIKKEVSQMREAQAPKIQPSLPRVAGLLPSVTQKTSITQGTEAIVQQLIRQQAGDEAGVLVDTKRIYAALQKNIEDFLRRTFTVIEVDVTQTTMGIKDAMGAFAYLAQALQDAESRAVKAKIGDAVSSLITKVVGALRSAEAQAIIPVKVVDYTGQRSVLPPTSPITGSPRLALPSAGETTQPGQTRFNAVSGGYNRPAPLEARPFYMAPAFASTTRRIPGSAGRMARGTAKPKMVGQEIPLGPSGGGPEEAAFVKAAQNALKFGLATDIAKKSVDNFRASQLPLIGGLREIGSEFGFAIKQVLLFGTAYKALAFVQSLPGQILNAAKSQQQYNNALQTATQDTGTFAKELLYVDNVQRAFGLNLETTRTGFTRLYASMAPTGFDSGSIEKLFTGISAATAALQLTPDKAERVIYAFGQMASKGQIMSEELKGQLGDVLPGALAIFAKAAGMSVKEFSKAMEDGEFVGSKFRDTFAKVADELMNRFGTGAQAAGKSLQGLLNTVQGDFQRTLESFAPLANAAAQAILGPLGGSLKQLSMSAQIATGEIERTFAQLKQAQQDVADLKIGGADASEIKAAEQNVAALAARYQVLQQAAKDPAIAKQAQDIQLFTQELAKAGTFVMNVANAIGNIFGPILRALGTNMTSVISTVIGLYTAFQTMRLVAMGTMGALLAYRAISTILGFSQATVGAKALAGAFNALGVAATGAQIKTIGLTRALQVFTASTIIGAVVAGIVLVASAFATMRDRANEAQQAAKDSLQATKDAATQGGTAMVQMQIGVTKVRQQDVETAVQLLETLRKTADASKTIRLTTGQQRVLELGGIQVPRGGEYAPGATTALVQQANAQRKILKDTLRQQEQDLIRAKSNEKRIGLNVPTPPSTKPETEAPDEKALKKAQQDAEQAAKQEQQRRIELAGLQNDMDKIGFDYRMGLSDTQFEHEKQLIDELNNYELSGLNDRHARQLKFAQDLKKVQLNAIDAIRKARQKVDEAQLNVVTARRSAQAAGGGGGISSGPIIGGFTPAQLSSATAAASKFTGIANMCSESVKAFYKSLGISLPGVTAWADTVRNAGTTMKDWSKLAPGDIVATGKPGDTPHVGVYTGGQNVFHQSRSRGLRAGNYPDLDYFKQGGYFVRPSAGIKQSSASFSMDTKAQKESFDLIKEQAKASAQTALQQLEIQNALKIAYVQTASTIKANIDNIFPVEKQKLDLSLQQMRHNLLMQGMPQEYIDYEEKRAAAMEEAAMAVNVMKDSLSGAKAELKVYNDAVAGGTKLSVDQQANVTRLTGSIAALEEGLANAAKQQREYNIASLESAIATMKQADALKAMEEVSGRINDAVTGVTDTYKSLFKEIAMGEDSVEALKKAQQALADQFLTMVFDMAMKPVEESMKNTLGKMFGVPNEKEQREKTIASMEAQLAELQAHKVHLQNIETNTGIAAGKSPVSSGVPAAPAVPNQMTAAGTSGGFLTGTAALQTLPFNGQTGGMLQNLPFPAGDTGFLSSIGINSEELSASISESANAYSEQLSKVDTSVFESANALGTAGTELGKEGAAGKKWHESLGQAVGGLGMAAGAVMGIVAGINQIKEGGTSNVLGGIGMIASMAGSLLGNFGGLFGGGGGASSIVQGTDIPIAQMPAGMQFANGGVAFGGFRAFANGGTVSGPTLGLVGEGKYNEAIVPLPDGRSIPVQLGGRSARDLMGNGAPGMPQAPSLSMKFETTKINGVEYVSREQLEQAMAETRRASIAGGAQRGMSMTLDKIKQSPSTRSSIGIR
jgi:tape measure domain-containing protein